MEAEKEPRGNETMGEGPPECSPPKASRVEVTPELAARGSKPGLPAQCGRGGRGSEGGLRARPGSRTHSSPAGRSTTQSTPEAPVTA